MLEATQQPIAIAPRPSLYTSLVPIPIACLLGALITDVTYWQSTSVVWQIFSIWLIVAGLVTAGLAILVGLVELVTRRRTPSIRPAWPGLVCLMLVFALSLVNAFVHSRDAYTSIVPTGLALSAAAMLIFVISAFARPGPAPVAGAARGRSGILPALAACLGVFALGIGSVFAFNGAADTSVDPAKQIGANPVLPEPHHYLLPPMHIAPVAKWGPNDTPTVPAGLKIEALARDLQHPRFVYVLPNADVLIVESSGPKAPIQRPKDVIMGWVQTYAGAKEQGGNRITLIRAANGNTPALRTVFLDHLTSPFGVALVGHDLYVADTDALMRYAYTDGATSIAGPGTVLTPLPGGPIDHHWTKSLIASPDGYKLYVGVGSNSNITENGIQAELNRAAVWEIDRATGAYRIFASGIRNPTGLGWEPQSGKLWAIANERDEIGPNLVPDYLTSVQDGGFYGWPYSYYGQHVDPRVQPQRPDLVARAIPPDYALGSHMAPLGVAFTAGTGLPAPYQGGVFVGEHGSWDRNPLSGYKVVFVPFSNGHPNGTPVDVVTGFLTSDGHARGRPVGLALDSTGALLVADDLGNSVWRVTPNH